MGPAKTGFSRRTGKAAVALSLERGRPARIVRAGRPRFEERKLGHYPASGMRSGLRRQRRQGGLQPGDGRVQPLSRLVGAGQVAAPAHRLQPRRRLHRRTAPRKSPPPRPACAPAGRPSGRRRGRPPRAAAPAAPGTSRRTPPSATAAAPSRRPRGPTLRPDRPARAVGRRRSRLRPSGGAADSAGPSAAIAAYSSRVWIGLET